MVLRKITFMVFLVMILLNSCLIESPNNSVQELSLKDDSAKSELLTQMTRDIFYQDSIMRVINTELSRIDAMYVSYEGGIESQRGNNNQAAHIISRIRQLNGLLESTRTELRKNSLENKGLFDMIDRFKRELETKEEKIKELQNTVSEQEHVIARQDEKIDLLEVANARQRQQLLNMEQEIKGFKAKAYSDLADLLIQIAVELPEVRGIFTRRTRDDVEQMQKSLILDAHGHFEQAAIFGDNYARTRLSELKMEYAFLQ